MKLDRHSEDEGLHIRHGSALLVHVGGIQARMIRRCLCPNDIIIPLRSLPVGRPACLRQRVSRMRWMSAGPRDVAEWDLDAFGGDPVLVEKTNLERSSSFDQAEGVFGFKVERDVL